MYAILEKPSNLPNKINFEQKQNVPGSLNLPGASSLDNGQELYDIYFYKRNRRLMLASRCILVVSLILILFFYNSRLRLYVLQTIMLLDCTCNVFNFAELTVQWLTM